MKDRQPPQLLRAAEIASMAETRHQHQFKETAVRLTRSLGTTVGLERVGVHLIRLQPGSDSTQYHSHSADEEFIYVLAGRAVAELDGSEFTVAPGDFIGLPAPGPAHNMRNDFDEDCLYLVGGERNPLDQVDYPRIRRTLLKDPRRWVDWDDVNDLS